MTIFALYIIDGVKVFSVEANIKKNLDLTRQDDFTQFFSQTHLHLYRYLYGLTGGLPEDVEDLVAETYSSAWSAGDKFNGDQQAALRWLFTIAKRKMIDSYRKRKTKEEIFSIESVDLPSFEFNPEEQTLFMERRKILWSLVQTLSVENQEILILRYLLEWKVGEIAIYLGKKETAVSMAIRRALKRLQDAWPIGDELIGEENDPQ